jgi:hypothetical protein
MDPNQQMIQALMGVFQQGLQILQQAQTGAAAPPGPMGGDPAAAPGDAPGGAPAAGGPPGGAMDDDGDDDMYGDDQGNPGGMGDDASDDGMGDGQSLHDRVSQLEGHTGLKKSAGGSLCDRITGLEIDLLGTEYEGPMVERVRQLEKAAGVQPTRKSAVETAAEESPDEIPLDALIKAATQAGIRQGVQEALATLIAQSDAGDSEGEIPDLSQMRKAARNGGDRFGKRRGNAATVLSDADLVKSAAQLGWSEDELDQEFSLGDALQMQYNAQQAGEAIPFADDDDD